MDKRHIARKLEIETNMYNLMYTYPNCESKGKQIIRDAMDRLSHEYAKMEGERPVVYDRDTDSFYLTVPNKNGNRRLFEILLCAGAKVRPK